MESETLLRHTKGAKHMAAYLPALPSESTAGAQRASLHTPASRSLPIPQGAAGTSKLPGQLPPAPPEP